MAQRITVALEDDLDGGPADETVRFAFGGTEYEIDLNKKNAGAFRKKLAPFVEHARKAGRGQRRPRTPSSRRHSSEIRKPPRLGSPRTPAWASANGSPADKIAEAVSSRLVMAVPSCP